MNSSTRINILLDSTYLLPIVGVEVEGIRRALIVLRRLKKEKIAKFYYTHFSLLEIMAKIAKTNYDSNIVATGLTSIFEEFEPTNPTIKGYLKAIELKKKGYKDFIDLLLYTTSLTNNLLFLTRDDNLIEFLKETGEEIKHILHERTLIKKFT